jgi:hypothetical protein
MPGWKDNFIRLFESIKEAVDVGIKN